MKCLYQARKVSKSGADPGFQVRGSHFFGVFRVKNHDFTPKNLIFSNFRGGGGGAPGGSAPVKRSCMLCVSGICFVSFYDISILL
jgi:hypothetical protein